MSDLREAAKALLPCPFCGGPVQLEQAHKLSDMHGEFWGVVCRNTTNLGGSCCMEQVPSASKEAAIGRWNRRAALAADEVSVPREDDYAASMTTCELRGPRLVGPHGGLRGNLPNPTDEDLADPLFEAIWQTTKTWDVNAPEYYVGYCGLNGSHVMLILNAIRTALAAHEKEPRNG